MLTSSMGHDEDFASFDFAAVLYKPVKPSLLCKTMLEVFSHESPQVIGSASTESTEEDQRPLRILIAEDNMVNQRVCVLLLKKLGFAADTANNGLEALEAIKRKTYDVVLMDVQMPKMDGLAATREICRSCPEGVRPYIIGVSAHAMSEERERALGLGMSDYLTKPVHLDELRYALLKVPMPHPSAAPIP
jgi:CheY-like chemotaxis protein